MTERKKLWLSIAPFALAAFLLLIVRPGLAKQKLSQARSAEIALVFDALDVRSFRSGGQGVLCVSVRGEMAGFFNERVKLSTGLKMRPFDSLKVGPLRLLYEATPRDWRSSLGGGWLVADYPRDRPQDETVPAMEVGELTQSELYRSDTRKGSLDARRVPGGSEIEFMGHPVLVTGGMLRVDGRSFPLDSPPTTIVLDRGGKIIETRTH